MNMSTFQASNVQVMFQKKHSKPESGSPFQMLQTSLKTRCRNSAAHHQQTLKYRKND